MVGLGRASSHRRGAVRAVCIRFGWFGLSMEAGSNSISLIYPDELAAKFILMTF